MTKEEEDAMISEALQIDVEDIVFRPAYLPYSHWRIKEIYLSEGFELRPYYTWYKAMRYRSCQKFRIVNMFTNEIVGSEYGYTLEEFRYHLAKLGYPLHGESKTPEQKRREKWDDFLRIVASLDNPAD